jgi:ribosomal-protein-alanine acetyltransferase
LKASRAARRRAPTIRIAEPGDIEPLLAIENAVFPSDRLDRRGFRYGMRSPTIDILVASAGGATLGYAMVHRRRNSDLGRLTSIAVADGAAGRGLGRQLLAAAEERAKERGCGRLRLEVRADNRAAQRLYEKAGYARFETVPDYYEDGESAYRYEKVLT